ncbi:CdaR family protein [Planococcus sp. YIM B11945]|uniref:CdaR family protein n=1 Tax=Planococcus sp. YIM B11945 TaxID=3435410 RepID=UPI003D7C94F2
MDKMMDNPWFLRITALLLAFLLFFSVKADSNNTANTTDTATMTEVIEDVPIETYYDNTSLIVSGVPETADVTIIGPASAVQTARQIKDFTIFVDLRDLPVGQHQVPVQTENLSEQLRVRIDPAVVDVSIEERVTEEFRIDPEINERLLRDGFVLESLTAEPNTVAVTGPKSVIDAISFVKATVTGEEDLHEPFTAEAGVRILANDLTKLENVTIEPETVKMEVAIAEYSKEVPVTVRRTGEANNGITINSLKSSNETVRIFGPKTAVDPIDEYLVEVDIGAITAEDTTVESELKAPAGATKVTPGKLNVEANITVDESVRVPNDALSPNTP